MNDLTSVNLYDLIPDSIRDDPEVNAAIQAINGELQQVSQLCTVPSIYARIDQLDSKTLDHLAWQVDSKIWRDSWPVHLKRSVIKTVIFEKSKKGTRSAVEKAVESFGGAILIKEWWQYETPKTPHTFDVQVFLGEIEGTLPEDRQLDLILALNDVKPVRSHYTLTLATEAQAGIGFQGAVRPAVYRRITATEAPYGGGIGFQGALRPVSYVRITANEAVS